MVVNRILEKIAFCELLGFLSPVIFGYFNPYSDSVPVSLDSRNPRLWKPDFSVVKHD